MARKALRQEHEAASLVAFTVRKQRRHTQGSSKLSPFCLVLDPSATHKAVPLTFRVGLAFPSEPFWRHHQRQTQQCVSMAILN